MAVITVSRQFGSGGRRIARRASDLLGYRYFDKQAIIQAATEVGLGVEQVIDHPELYYEEKSRQERLWELLFGSRRMSIGHASRPVLTWGGLEARLDEDWFVELVNNTIREAYRQGNIVIVGRGGQAVLQNEPGVLHVRIQAPLGTRLWRLQAYEGLNNVDEAQRLIERFDRASAEYLQRFHRIRWDDPALYHLIINTGKTDPELAAHVIVMAAKQLEAAAAAA